MITLHCNGQPYACTSPQTIRTLMLDGHPADWRELDLSTLADAVWEDGE